MFLLICLGLYNFIWGLGGFIIIIIAMEGPGGCGA